MLRISSSRLSTELPQVRVVNRALASSPSLPRSRPGTLLASASTKRIAPCLPQTRQYSAAAQVRRPSPPPEKEEPFSELLTSLPGTAQAHRCLVLLNSSIPITEFPSRYSTKIQRQLQIRLVRLGGIVNFAWFGGPPPHVSGSSEGEGEEVLSGVAYTPNGGRLPLPHISLSTIDNVVEQLVSHMEATTIQPETQAHIDILVCTHGARDCRCGEKGGEVYEALKEEVQKIQKDSRDSPRVRVGEIAHVGGHKYAANVLIYPHGEWLGLIRPEDVPAILRKVLPPSHSNPPPQLEIVRPLGRNDPPILPERWRGRMGLGKDEQFEIFEETKVAGGV